MGPRRWMFVAVLVIIPTPQPAMTEGVAPIALAALSAGPLRSERDRAPLLRQGRAMFGQGQPLFDVPVAAGAENARAVEVWTKAPSLFAGQAEGSLFAPFPVRQVAARRAVAPLGGSAVDQLRHIIGQAESRHHGYDAVQHGARVRPGKRPTEMTLAEIFDWIEATPGQPHAIGRYQFIPTTLEWLVGRLACAKQRCLVLRCRIGWRICCWRMRASMISGGGICRARHS